jgi:hypothetical protein
MHIERALTRRRGGQQMYRKKYRGLCFCMTVAGSFSARRERMDPAIFLCTWHELHFTDETVPHR